MTTIRVKKDARYFSASNEPFNDKRLSWEARGLMGYLLSKPNNWKIRMHDLDEQGPAGARKLKRMLAELRLYGYMNRIRVKLDNGKFDWITDVYESPAQNPNPTKDVIKTIPTKRTTGKKVKASGAKRTSAKRTSAKRTSAKRTDLTKTDSPITELQNTEVIINKDSLDYFKSKFGKFHGEKELYQWAIFYDSVGPDRAKEISEWAYRKEIHLANRPSLLDSLMSAAKKWTSKPGKKQTAAEAAANGDTSKYDDPKWKDFLA
jgi:hypothetical protein